MPLTAWATHVLQWSGTEGSELAIVSESLKTGPSSDCRLQLACMKPELLVIADQHAAVNAFPGLVHTARHTTRVGGTRSQDRSQQERTAEGESHNWGEVVTR